MSKEDSTSFQSECSAFSFYDPNTEFGRRYSGDFGRDRSNSFASMIERKDSDASFDSVLPPPPPSSPPALPSNPVARYDPCSPHHHPSPNAYEPMLPRKMPMPHELSLTVICETEVKKMVKPMDFEGDKKSNQRRPLFKQSSKRWISRNRKTTEEAGLL